MKSIIFQNFCGKYIKIFVVCNKKIVFSDKAEEHIHTTYDYLLIFNQITGRVYKEMTNPYLIEEFLIKEQIINR